MDNTLDLQALEVFNVIANAPEGSITSVLLNYSDTRVYELLRNLEISFDTKLVRRESSGYVLTDAGREIAVYTAQISRLCAAIHNQLKDFPGLVSGTVTVGYVYPIPEMVLMPYKAEFEHENPAANLRAKYFSSGKEAVRGLLNGEITFAFVKNSDVNSNIQGIRFRSEKNEAYWLLWRKNNLLVQAEMAFLRLFETEGR